jgi:hypothetical protein
MDNLFFQRIKLHCNLFTGFCLVRTVLAVAHRNCLSLFSILSNKWIKHFFFDAEVFQIYRNVGEDSSLTVFLYNQKIKVLKQ